MAGLTPGAFDGTPFLKFKWGFIVYNDANRSIYPGGSKWETTRERLQDEAEYYLDNFVQSFTDSQLQYKMKEYAQVLYQMAENERANEMALLAKMGLDTTGIAGEDTEVYFLQNFNKIVLGEQVFNQNVTKLMATINKGGKMRAPSAAAFFVSRYYAALRDTINTLLADPIANYSRLVDPNDPIWEDIVQQSIEEAITNMFNPQDGADNNVYFGDASNYTGLLQLLQNNPAFYNFVHSYFDTRIDEVKSELSKAITAQQQKKTHKTLSAKQALKVSRQAAGKIKGNEIFERMIGGLVEEFVGNGRLELNITEQGANTKGDMLNNTHATDTILIASWKNECNLDRIDEILSSADTSATQYQIAQSLDKINKLLQRKKFEDAFIIHTSDKLYSMGDSFRGFDKGGNRVSDMKGLIAQSGLGGTNMSAETIVSLYLNSAIQGAALDKSFDTLKESFRTIIAGVAGSMLFSDWTMIGKQNLGGPTQLHVFNLNEVLIPFSYVLKALGKSFETFTTGSRGFKHTINITHLNRTEILYPASKGVDRYGITDEEYHSGNFHFMDYWRKQREDAQRAATFNIRFLSNFKSIVANQLASVI